MRVSRDRALNISVIANLPKDSDEQSSFRAPFCVFGRRQREKGEEEEMLKDQLDRRA